jgi:hypothetical protein
MNYTIESVRENSLYLKEIEYTGFSKERFKIHRGSKINNILKGI